MEADGFSLDDKRTELDHSKHEEDNLPDIVRRWGKRDAEKKRARTEQSFFVHKADIADADYDLSVSRYREVLHATVNHESPKQILRELAALEDEIRKGIEELQGAL
jgi:type I restriction enzyme M protein